jgi:hypothetical protein
MFFRKSKMVLFSVTAFSVITGMALSAAAQSSTTATRSSSFPPVGLSSTETIQINVVNNASASSSGTAASCSGTISFTNSSGTIIGAATSFTVTHGQIFSASLPFSKAGASTTRAEIVGSVQLTLSNSTPCALVQSLETYDTSSGVTHVFLTGAQEQQGGFGPFGH